MKLFASLFLFRSVVLQQLRHGLVQVFLVLFLVRAGVDSLGCISGPDELLCRRIIQIKDQSPNNDCRARSSRHPASADTATHSISIPLLFLIDSDLVADIKISLFAVSLGQPL